MKIHRKIHLCLHMNLQEGDHTQEMRLLVLNFYVTKWGHPMGGAFCIISWRYIGFNLCDDVNGLVKKISLMQIILQYWLLWSFYMETHTTTLSVDIEIRHIIDTIRNAQTHYHLFRPQTGWLILLSQFCYLILTSVYSHIYSTRWYDVNIKSMWSQIY